MGCSSRRTFPPAQSSCSLGGRLVSITELEALIADADAGPQAPFIDTITIRRDQHLVLP